MSNDLPEPVKMPQRIYDSTYKKLDDLLSDLKNKSIDDILKDSFRNIKLQYDFLITAYGNLQNARIENSIMPENQQDDYVFICNHADNILKHYPEGLESEESLSADTSKIVRSLPLEARNNFKRACENAQDTIILLSNIFEQEALSLGTGELQQETITNAKITKILLDLKFTQLQQEYKATKVSLPNSITEQYKTIEENLCEIISDYEDMLSISFHND